MESNGNTQTATGDRRLSDIQEGTPNKKPAPLTTASIATAVTLGICTPTTPRIDISRASSSSHHDSRDSSPDNVFDQVSAICRPMTPYNYFKFNLSAQKID